MNVKRVGILAWKDIVDAIRTPRLLTIVITPLIIALSIQIFFGNKLTIRIGLYSPDKTQLVEILGHVDFISTETFDSLNALEVAVSNNKLTAGVALPENFDNLLASSQFSTVNFIVSEDSNESRAAISLVQQTILAMSPISLPIKTETKILVQNAKPGISLREDLPINQYAIVLWLITGLVGNGVMLVPTLLVEEKERKTFDALLLSPASYYDIISAKALVGVLYCVISSILILLAQGGLTGSFWLALSLIIAGSFLLSLFGLLLGNLSENLNTLNSYGGLFVFLLTLPAFAGLLGPNPVIKYLQFLPTYFLTQGIVSVASGQTDKALLSLTVILAECFITLGVVVWGLKKNKRAK